MELRYLFCGMDFFKKRQPKANEQEKLGHWPLRLRVFNLVSEFELTKREQPEIFVVHSGRAVLDSNGGTGKQVIARGTIMVIPSGGRQKLSGVDNLSMTGLRFLPEWLAASSEAILQSPDAAALWGVIFFFEKELVTGHEPQIFSLEELELSAIESDLAVLRRELTDERSESGMSMHTLLKILLHLAAAHGKFWRGEQHLQWKPETHELVEFLERAASCGRRINLRQIAKEYGSSESEVTSLMEDGTGLDPIDYLERRRAQFAARLMLGSELSDAEIASRTGYASTSKMEAQLKAVFGRTAAEYRSDFCG